MAKFCPPALSRSIRRKKRWRTHSKATFCKVQQGHRPNTKWCNLSSMQRSHKAWKETMASMPEDASCACGQLISLEYCKMTEEWLNWNSWNRWKSILWTRKTDVKKLILKILWRPTNLNLFTEWFLALRMKKILKKKFKINYFHRQKYRNQIEFRRLICGIRSEMKNYTYPQAPIKVKNKDFRSFCHSFTGFTMKNHCFVVYLYVFLFGL